MWHSIVDICRQNPLILIFLALALGYLLGKIKFFGLSLGSTAGVLIVALILGQIGVEIPALLQSIGFALFIFAIGYRVGPQFLNALKDVGAKYIWLALVVAAAAFFTAVGLGKWLGFDPGTAAGMLAGAMTSSATIGTADGAIKGLGIPAAQKNLFLTHVAVAYAITYIFGTIGRILYFKITPRLSGVDLKTESRKLERTMMGGEAELERPELFSWYKNLSLHAYKVAQGGNTVREIEAKFPEEVVIERIKRGHQLIEPAPDFRLEEGDKVALVGDLRAFLPAGEIVGKEIDDRELESVIGEIIDICVLNKEAIGKTLGEISKDYGYGIFLRRLTRHGHELPLTRDTVLHKCDVLTVAGGQKKVEAFIKYLGYPERPTSVSDLIMIGLGCVFGTLIGLISITVFGIPITLGVGGGVMVAGLVCGWLRAVHPTFGQIPSGAQWLLTDLGLNLFIACVGLSAGPKAVEALRVTGGAVFFAGVAVTLVPMIVGLLFGKIILKLNPVLLFGALTGAGVITAALNTLKEDAESSAPALGFAVPYAINTVILTVCGAVIVHLFPP